MEKRKPSYLLADLKRVFAHPATLNRSFTSKQGADALGMNDADVIEVMQSLSMRDFDKSMTSNVDSRIWQDVYRPRVKDRQLYMKFTLDAQQNPFLISFKEA